MAFLKENVKCYLELKTEPIWWYHPDHLGSSSYLTDYSGIPSHYYNYLPFGEEMVSQNTSSYNNIYRFSGKELDEETGLSYFGARYYNPKWGMWLSVDPLAEKYPNYNPYNYCLNNPLNMVDQDGKAPDDIVFKDKKGNKLATYKDGKKEITNITLPIDNFGSSPNVNLNKATANLTDVDVLGIGISGEATYGIGAGAGQEFLYYLDGKNKGEVYAYSYASVTLGVGGEGLSISAIAGNWLNNDSNLSANDYLGPFNFYSGNTPVAGITYFWGSKDNDIELYPGMAEIWNPKYKQTWTGTSISAPGPNVSATAGRSFYVFTTILNKLLQKCGLQKK
jgi:RHS repeat-associated protein